MRIEYTCKDGSRTLALWPSMALLHWLGRSRPTRPIENPQPFKVHVVATSLPTDDHEMLLTLVYAEIEQRRKKTPPFAIQPPNPKKKHGGKKYQARCLEVLQWLHAEGDIATLVISPES